MDRGGTRLVNDSTADLTERVGGVVIYTLLTQTLLVLYYAFRVATSRDGKHTSPILWLGAALLPSRPTTRHFVFRRFQPSHLAPADFFVLIKV